MRTIHRETVIVVSFSVLLSLVWLSSTTAATITSNPNLDLQNSNQLSAGSKYQYSLPRSRTGDVQDERILKKGRKQKRKNNGKKKDKNGKKSKKTASPAPSSQPSNKPSVQPSNKPSSFPSVKPSYSPSNHPSSSPSESMHPSSKPSSLPSVSSVPSTSMHPSFQPSNSPSVSSEPSNQPSNVPSTSNSPSVSTEPSDQPSNVPSTSNFPSVSAEPSISPSVSTEPSNQPSNVPSTSNLPSKQPSSVPSDQPSRSMQPSSVPSSEPSFRSCGSGNIPVVNVVASNNDPSFLPSNILDCNTGTGWRSGTSALEWIYVDFGSIKNINSFSFTMKLISGPTFTDSITLEVSNDGMNWGQSSTFGIHDTKYYPNPGSTLNYPLPKTGQYYRLRFTDSPSFGGVELYELSFK